MKLTVVIVSYNVKHYLEQCLVSLERAVQGLNAEIIVIDNNSADGSVSYISKRFSHVTVIGSHHNLGFAKANNRVIRQTSSEYVLLLNPDTIVGEDVIKEVLAFMDTHPKSGGVGVRMLKIDGSDAMESRRGIPSPTTAFYKMSGLCNRFPSSKRFGKYYMSYLPWDQPVQIEIISGAFCMLRRQALDEIGLLDEDFFMYGEDIDLSYRLLKGGWENWYLPLKILHYKGESTQKSSFRYVHVFYEAMLIFFRKHYSHLGWLLSIPIQFAIYLKASAELVKLLIGRARKNLGFVIRKSQDEPRFLVYTSAEHQVRCEELLYRNALRAEVVTNADMSSILTAICTDKPIYLTFDIKIYRFGDILDLFSRHGKGKQMSMAMYHPEHNMIITDSDIII